VVELPADLLATGVGISTSGESRGFRCVGCGAQSVRAHVRHPRGLRGGSGGCHCRWVTDIAGGAARDESASNLASCAEFAARKRPRAGDRVARARICG
jgi:hypothetical protein